LCFSSSLSLPSSKHFWLACRSFCPSVLYTWFHLFFASSVWKKNKKEPRSLHDLLTCYRIKR
jgi:hypothetical protein